MLEKLKAILGSIRFWQITISFLSQIIKLYFPEQEVLFNIITGWLLTVAGVGTVDKWSQAIKESK